MESAKTFNCPKCGDASPKNVLGDFDNKEALARHPYISKQGFRVCKPSWGNSWRMGAFGATDYEEARI